MANPKPRTPQIKDRYFIDNLFFRGGWAAKLGVHAIAVYNVLALHANEEQVCWPSHSTIAKLTGMSQRQVIREVERLAEYNIVSIQSRQAERKSGIVTLLDKSEWIDVEHMTRSHMSDSHMTRSHMTYDSESYEHMTPSHINNTNKQYTNNKGELNPGPFANKLLEVCRINYDTASDKLKSELAETIKVLGKIEATIEQLDSFKRFWGENWRGKGGSPPTLKQVRDLWGEFQDWVKTSGNGHQPKKVRISAI